jgi:hypothetical protein
MRTEFSRMPGEARLWIFAAERALNEDEQRELFAELDAFLEEWRAHGQPLSAARDLRYGQFLMVAADESAAGASGCSIDALTGVLRRLEQRLGVELANHAPVFYRTQAGVGRVTRAQFARMAAAGDVTPDTTIFDNAASRVADVHEGRWERPARESWHARAFFAGVPTPS